MLLNCLPPRINYHQYLNKPAKYTIQETFSVDGVGTVVSGFLLSGTISVKSSVWLGPDSTGAFRKVVVKSIHDKRMEINTGLAGHSICLALRNVDRDDVHRGMMVIDGSLPEPKGIREFTALIEIFGRHSTSVRVGYEPVINIANIRQTAKIMSITDVIRRMPDPSKKVKKSAIPENDSEGNPVLRTGDKARVHFRLCHQPVYFESGAKILFREAFTRGVGLVERVVNYDDVIDLTKKEPEPQASKNGGSKRKISIAERRKLKKEGKPLPVVDTVKPPTM